MMESLENRNPEERVNSSLAAPLPFHGWQIVPQASRDFSRILQKAEQGDRHAELKLVFDTVPKRLL
jgi:hypothetical protein